MKGYIKTFSICLLFCSACNQSNTMTAVNIENENLQQKVSQSNRYSAYSLLDRQDKTILKKSSPRTLRRMQKGETLTINDLIRLAQSGVNDQTVLAYLKQTRANYSLSQLQIKRLQDAGVSPRIVNFIIETGR